MSSSASGEMDDNTSQASGSSGSFAPICLEVGGETSVLLMMAAVLGYYLLGFFPRRRGASPGPHRIKLQARV